MSKARKAGLSTRAADRQMVQHLMTTTLGKLCHDSDWSTNGELLKQRVRHVHTRACCLKPPILPRDGAMAPWPRCCYLWLGCFGVQHPSAAGCPGGMATTGSGCHVGNGLSHFSFLADIGSVRTKGHGNERTAED
jgi:hypothetical protein